LYGQFPPGELSLSTTDGGPALRPGLLLTDFPSQLGYIENDDEHPLFISITDGSAHGIVGSLTLGSRSSSLKAPHPKRKERWVQLNKILGKNKKKLKSSNSTGYSYVKWNQIKHLLRTTPYVQSSKTIPDIQANFLTEYLSFAEKCFDPVVSGKESRRIHFIAPVIICVCFLFNGDVQIEVEEDLAGNFLKAHGHFEFVLRRGDKRVCIVEAKKDDMNQGMAQDLLGCEVAAEINNLDLVYGIVTNYVQWIFLRSLDEKIEMDNCFLSQTGGAVDKASIVLIASKIYAMLSDE
jgi:hypothetical protein